MCIITSTVSSVKNTKLYVSVDSTGTRQLTIYSNTVDTPQANAMILPVPNPSSVEFVNLKSYPKFFSDCANCFRYLRARPYIYEYMSVSRSASSLSTLEVHDVGSYKASIVPTLDDFDRLDTEVFDVDENLLPMLRRHYPYRFGFIVCQLKPGNRSYHPFAYTHDLDSCGKLFVPTRHYHPQSHGHATADWDHIIYSPLTDLDNTKQKGYEFRGTKDVAWSKLPEAYRWGSVVQMSRWEMEGDFKNMDLWATSYHREADAEVWNSLGKHLVDLIGGSMIVQGYFKN